MFNYYNSEDYALTHERWELNNALKPDGIYSFGYSGREDYYDESSSNYFYRGVDRLSVLEEIEQYQIFSYCAESRSKALGTQNGKLRGQALISD